KDIEPCKEASMNLQTPHHILDGIEDVELMIALLKHVSVMCAMRLHALVFSAAAGIPFIGVSYDIKVDGFMEYSGNSCCTKLEDVNEQWLCSQIDKAMAEPQAFEGIARRLRELESLNKQAAEELL
ncbi:MAG: polysaccharide pyruvyl transferase family protein, partial [Clostridia bacterium]|nr:polysaccharide pyruvyl transferase family protein [Clostridia bacterium]